MARTRSTKAETKPARKQTTISKTSFKHSAAAPSPSAAEAKRITKIKHDTKSNSSRSSSLVPERVLTDVLLAIQPIHLSNIVKQRKNHEYRNYRLCDGVQRLWLYETRGTKQDKGLPSFKLTTLRHIATIPLDIRHSPGNVPEVPFGIDNAEFNAGLEQSGFGYPILELYQLVKPITLDEMKKTWGMGMRRGE
ncbi:hypothetical protein AK830_g2316 [Neonectria ditissima]|uniref:ASCH domain-containing protein n=1 Tax=Neonectria ditissima TaxID=78410 RepID=A0A0P7BS22_9HYPO|nr:hypothetical protein AK830_g2316 [Neonectria ditissima]